jgi:uncharacterized protein (TIRG00374 family)
MNFRTWVSLVTLVLIFFVVYFAWNEIVEAWLLLDRVNIWVWLLLIPAQFLSYYATGAMIFSYLQSKGDMKLASRWQTTRIALELNFVNHILPSGSAAGFSYLSWVLHHHGVSVGRSTMSQIIRFALTFVSFVFLIVLSVVLLTFDHMVDRNIISVSLILALISIGVTWTIVYLLSNKERLSKFAVWLTRFINKVLRIFSRKKEKRLALASVEKFFADLHQDYLEIRSDKKILLKPFLWAALANLMDIALLAIAFLALGFWVNPAVLFLGFGIASIAGVFSAMPGGAGAYDAAMIAFLVSAGTPVEIAITGTLIARITLLTGTVVFGYVFYQLTINKYGKVSK